MALTLPPELTQLAESHPCFSGCWESPAEVTAVVQPGVVDQFATVQCADCLSFRIGAPLSLLGTSPRGSLASALSAHVHQHRGYGLSVGGYHLTPGGGFWLAASWLPLCGAFLVWSDRGHHASDPVARLIEACNHGVLRPPDPGMLVAGNYRTHAVYLDVLPGLVFPTVSALLQSPQVSTQRQPGFVPVTIAEYLPFATASARVRRSRVSRPTTAPPGPPPKREKKLGDRCDVCGEIVEVRQLLYTTYVGCHCP